jgi:hypothetical protein
MRDRRSALLHFAVVLIVLLAMLALTEVTLRRSDALPPVPDSSFVAAPPQPSHPRP